MYTLTGAIKTANESCGYWLPNLFDEQHQCLWRGEPYI